MWKVDGALQIELLDIQACRERFFENFSFIDIQSSTSFNYKLGSV